MFRYLPEQASEFAPMVDRIHHLITDISVFFTVAIVGSMLYFAIRYRKRNGVDHETPHIEGSVFLEVLWTVVPTIICVVVAVYGYRGFEVLREPPPGALEIQVIGQQWKWMFEYPNGKKTSDEFVVPVNKPIKLVITSVDVLHSFFLPGMRTKVDAIPKQYTYQWFKPVKTGPQQAFCTEYCGTTHSGMLATMRVVSEAEYERWVNDKGAAASPEKIGQKLYKDQGCNACHSIDGTKVIGPSFLNSFGTKGIYDEGVEYVRDENYLRESILNPQAHIVQGYPKPSPMPAFEGRLSEEDIRSIIAFIKSLKGEPKKVAPVVTKDTSAMTPLELGKELYTSKACIGCHSLDGSKIVGPSFKGLYGRSGELDDGAAYAADDAYIKESILNSQAKIVKGYPKPSPMPPYAGQLSDKEVDALIEYIKSLK